MDAPLRFSSPMGAMVIGVGRKPGPLAQTAEVARGSSGKVLPYVVDVTDEERVRSMISEAEKNVGAISFNSTMPGLAELTRRLSICRSRSSMKS